MGKDKHAFIKGVLLSSNKEIFYEAIFNIAVYNCNRNYIIGCNNSKRALSSVLVITDYLDNLPKTSKEKVNGI